MQVKKVIHTPSERTCNMQIGEVLDAIESGDIDGMETLIRNPIAHSELREIVDAIARGRRQLKDLKIEFPALYERNRKGHNKNVQALEKEAESILEKLGIDLVMEEE